jgi:hypothetical protein
VSKKEEKHEDLLKALCGNDAELYQLLGRYLYVNPTVAAFKSDLGILTENAEKCTNEENYREAMEKYQVALGKAIFDATQNPAEKDRYVKVIKDLALKASNVAELLKKKLVKEGLVGYASSLEGRIKDYRFMNERIEDVTKTASLFYGERLEELKAGEMQEARKKERYEATREEEREEKTEREMATKRREERGRLGRGERREVEREDKRKEHIEKEKREARRKEREATELEEDKKEREEDEKREARRKERRETSVT